MLADELQSTSLHHFKYFHCCFTVFKCYNYKRCIIQPCLLLELCIFSVNSKFSLIYCTLLVTCWSAAHWSAVSFCVFFLFYCCYVVTNRDSFSLIWIAKIVISHKSTRLCLLSCNLQSNVGPVTVFLSNAQDLAWQIYVDLGTVSLLFLYFTGCQRTQ